LRLQWVSDWPCWRVVDVKPLECSKVAAIRASILASFSRKIVSDYLATSFGSANERRKFDRADVHQLQQIIGWFQITSDGGLLAYGELDDALGLTAVAASALAEGRRGRNIRHRLPNPHTSAASV
jgi:hypothetical protein